MPRIIAVIVELLVSVCALWAIFFLSTFLHELGHAAGYMLATGDRRWHIRVGWGKRLLNTKRLTVNLLVFDGFFTPDEKEFGTKAKLIAMLLGGPVFSLLLTAGLFVLRSGGLSVRSAILSDSAVRFFLDTAFSVNLFILVLSLVPARYFFGKIRGLETDGLQIVHALRRKDGEDPGTSE